MKVISTLSPTSLQNAAGILLGSLSLAYYLRQRASHKTRLPLPPSPKGWPIIGNALEMPLENIAQEYARWGRELDSDIISATALGKSIIVLNSIEKTLDLLDKRSSKYSSRFQSTMAGEMLGFDYPFVLLPYDERWRERRRMFVQHFRPGDTSIIYPQAREFVQRFLLELHQTPSDFLDIIRGTMGAFIISLAYGFPIESHGNPHLEFSEATTKMLSEVMTPGTNFIDAFPVLKHLPLWAPGAGANRKAKELRFMAELLRTAPFDEALSKFGTEEGRPSFVSVALSALDDTSDSKTARDQKEIIKDAAAMFYMAGTDTIFGTIVNWIWVMLKHPEVQARVHAEVDEVLKGRMPDFEDVERLPYLMATVMESSRWAPATPIGVPHFSTEDDVYSDYFIPKDSIIIANVWAMLRNDNDYPSGAVFDPSRFLTPDGKLDRGVRDPFTIVLGFGRRACPGGHIGRSMVWLVAASLAALFKWTEPLGKDGKPINQPMDYESGMVYQPKPFKCDFKVRSPEAEAMLANMEG